MKKIIMAVLVVFMVLGLSCCSDVYDEVIISDIKSYNEIWQLPERRVGEESKLFVQNLGYEDYEDFICKHTTHQLVGTSWQVLLKMAYNDEQFDIEKKRLSELCVKSPICGETYYFDKLAYATVWNWNGCYEYAIFDDSEKSVCYIYLQLIEKEDLIFEEKYLPLNYNLQTNNSSSYSLYSNTNTGDGSLC